MPLQASSSRNDRPSAMRVLVSGGATGEVVATTVPLSFWGGVDPASGRVIDSHHPLAGQSLAGRILVMPSGRGSCSGSGVIMQMLLDGTAPAALVLSEPDEILTLGVIVARRILGRSIPVVQVSRDELKRLAREARLTIEAPPSPQAAEIPTLSETDRAMLRGEHGEAARIALEIVVEMAGILGARELIDIGRAHIDGCVYTGEAGLIFARRLVELGGQVRVPTTLNAVSVDQRRWRALGVPAELGEPASALAEAYVALGAAPSFTCAPYYLADPPRFGEQIVWAESNAVVFANSVIGARTIKYPDYLDICCAIAGRAPAIGCHDEAGRRPALTIAADGLAQSADDAFWPLLAYVAGALSGPRIPLITGLADAAPSTDALRAFSAAFATTSAAPMFHIEGITPEAPAGVARPSKQTRIARPNLRKAWTELNGTGSEGAIDLVAIGNPHASLDELRALARLSEGCAGVPAVPLIVTCGREIFGRAEREGLVAALENRGVRFVNDTCWCMIGEPVIPIAARRILTNSAKYAHYGPGLTGRGFAFGSLAQCVASAWSGRFDAALPGWLS